MGVEVVIVGAGVIGLMLARELAEAGVRVQVVERGAIGRESSWAGGGIVSPLYPWRYPAAVTALASWAQDFYPGFCAELEAAGGIDPEYTECGLLMVDAEDEDEALAWSARTGRPAERLAPEAVRELQPGIRPAQRATVWMPKVAQLRPPRLVQALRADLARRGVDLVEGCEIRGVRHEAGRVAALRSAKGELRGGHFVFCAGAWSGELSALLGLTLPVSPVRGQMLLFGAGPASLKRMVLAEGRYLIPRRDGRVLVGSTVEHVGYARLPTRAAHDSLYASALSLCPALQDYNLEAQWSGLRPGSPNGIPFIGRLPGYENAWVNAGHFRNGVVLAPAATRLLADRLLERPAIVDPEPYAPPPAA